MAKRTTVKVGDRVDFHCLHANVFGAYSATVTEVHPADGGPQALALTVSFTDDMLAEGLAADQSHAREGDPANPQSGEWTHR